MKKLLFGLQAFGFMSLAPVAFAAEIEIQQPSTVTVNQIGNVISAVVGILIIVAAILAFLYLIIGGIQWITSGGDKAGMEAARGKITQAIVGLIIVAAAWAVMVLAGQFIGFNILGGKFNIPTIQEPNPGGVPQ